MPPPFAYYALGSQNEQGEKCDGKQFREVAAVVRNHKAVGIDGKQHSPYYRLPRGERLARKPKHRDPCRNQHEPYEGAGRCPPGQHRAERRAEDP